MADQTSEAAVLREINPDELVELGKSLVRIPSFIGEETALARWLASYFPPEVTRSSFKKWTKVGSRRWPP